MALVLRLALRAPRDEVMNWMVESEPKDVVQWGCGVGVFPSTFALSVLRGGWFSPGRTADKT